MPIDPIALFDDWFAEARAGEVNDANAMALATADAAGRPSVRMVLLKGHGADGFVFYTNLDSRKGDEIAANPHAALLFHWKSLRRQVRIEAVVGRSLHYGTILLGKSEKPFSVPSQTLTVSPNREA